MSETLKNQFSIGIIDNDKRQHSYVTEFVEIAHTEHIMLMKHNSRSHYFIRISPAIDRFILDCAAEQNVNLQDYGLPSELSKFTNITKDVNVKNDYRFKELFKAINKSREMTILRSILNYLNTQQYQSKREELQRIFDI